MKHFRKLLSFLLFISIACLYSIPIFINSDGTLYGSDSWYFIGTIRYYQRHRIGAYLSNPPLLHIITIFIVSVLSISSIEITILIVKSLHLFTIILIAISMYIFSSLFTKNNFIRSLAAWWSLFASGLSAFYTKGMGYPEGKGEFFTNFHINFLEFAPRILSYSIMLFTFFIIVMATKNDNLAKRRKYLILSSILIGLIFLTHTVTFIYLICTTITYLFVISLRSSIKESVKNFIKYLLLLLSAGTPMAMTYVYLELDNFLSLTNIQKESPLLPQLTMISPSPFQFFNLLGFIHIFALIEIMIITLIDRTFKKNTISENPERIFLIIWFLISLSPYLLHIISFKVLPYPEYGIIHNKFSSSLLAALLMERIVSVCTKKCKLFLPFLVFIFILLSSIPSLYGILLTKPEDYSFVLTTNVAKSLTILENIPQGSVLIPYEGSIYVSAIGNKDVYWFIVEPKSVYHEFINKKGYEVLIKSYWHPNIEIFHRYNVRYLVYLLRHPEGCWWAVPPPLEIKDMIKNGTIIQIYMDSNVIVFEVKY